MAAVADSSSLTEEQNEARREVRGKKARGDGRWRDSADAGDGVEVSRTRRKEAEVEERRRRRAWIEASAIFGMDLELELLVNRYLLSGTLVI